MPKWSRTLPSISPCLSNISTFGSRTWSGEAFGVEGLPRLGGLPRLYPPMVTPGMSSFAMCSGPSNSLLWCLMPSRYFLKRRGPSSLRFAGPCITARASSIVEPPSAVCMTYCPMPERKRSVVRIMPGVGRSTSSEDHRAMRRSSSSSSSHQFCSLRSPHVDLSALLY